MLKFASKYYFLILVFCMWFLPLHGQFLGGSGRGDSHVLFAVGGGCASYVGGEADGYATIVLPNPDPCDYFDGSQADGSAMIFLINPDTCGHYDGGFADGGVMTWLPNPDTCGHFEGGLADGLARGFLPNPVPCTSFFASQQDGSASSFLSCSPLEVTASELYGRNEGLDGYLWWYTFSEVDNLGFIVQRSLNQIDWAEIAFVDGHTNSNTRIKYELLDQDMQEGLNYYRWQQIDLSGRSKFSNIVALVKQSPFQASLTIYPNPLQRGTDLKINFQSVEPTVVGIQIVDAFGRQIWESDYPASEAPLETTIPTDRLSAGVYFLILNTESDRISRRFIVR